jgi:hypothetical protein
MEEGYRKGRVIISYYFNNTTIKVYTVTLPPQIFPCSKIRLKFSNKESCTSQEKAVILTEGKVHVLFFGYMLNSLSSLVGFLF